MKIILIIILSLSFCISCKDSKKNLSSTLFNETLYIVDLDTTSTEDNVLMSSFFEDVETIILETNDDCFIGEANTVKFLDSLIIVMDTKHTNSILVFNIDGKFKHKIGRVGAGPGEYINIADSSIDFVKKEIYLYDFSTNRINIYDIKTGNFKRFVPVDEKNIMTYFIQYVNEDKLYTSATPYVETGDSYLLREIDIHTGKELMSYLNSEEYNKGWNELFTSPRGFFYQNSRECPKYVQMFMDTIVSIKGCGEVMPYLAVKSKKWISEKDVHNLIEYHKSKDGIQFNKILFENNIVYYINNVIEGNDITYFQIMDNGLMKHVVLDKKTNITRVINVLQDDIVYNSDRFMFPSFIYAEDNKVYSILNSDDIPLFLEIAYNNGLSMDLDKKEELTKLQEDSNPVIFVYHLKKSKINK